MMAQTGKLTSKLSDRRGFTLIEMAVSIVILSVVAVPLLYAYSIWVERQNYEATNERIETIKRAVKIYVLRNRILPCPAVMTAPIDTAEYGVATDCNNGAPAGTWQESGRSGGTVRVGAVPVRTLGLPDDYMADKWGNRFFYASTVELGLSPEELKRNSGAISLQDTNGNSLITPEDDVMYVIVSPGPDGIGAYAEASGTQISACPVDDPPLAADHENCNNDNTFRYTSLYTRAETGRHFDDLIDYELKEFLGLSSIKSYIVEEFECNDLTGVSTTPPSDFLTEDNEYLHCATAEFSGADIKIDNPAQASSGILLFTTSQEAKTDGRVVVRTVIPVTVDNELISSGDKWTDAIHAAIYIDAEKRAETVLLNPAAEIDDSVGFSSLVLAEGEIEKGETYNITVYLYSYGNENVNVQSGWAGSIYHTDHVGTAKIEIIEIEDF